MDFLGKVLSVHCITNATLHIFFSLCILFWITGGKHYYYWLILHSNSKTPQYQKWLPQILEELLWKQGCISDMIHNTNSTPSIYFLVITPSRTKRWTAVISISKKYLQINILQLCLWLKVMHVLTEMYDILRKHITKCIIPNQSIQRTRVRDIAVIYLSW